MSYDYPPLVLRCMTNVGGPLGDMPCHQPATVGIVTDEGEDNLGLFVVCSEHASEEVHEARSSMTEGDFVVITFTSGETHEGSNP